MVENEGKDMKTCSKCKVEKEKSWFYKDKSRVDGLSYICKECDKKKSKDWASKDGSSEKRRQSEKRRYWANPERFREKNRKFRSENQDSIRLYRKRYYAENREDQLAKSKIYRKENPGYFAAATRKRKAMQLNQTPDMNKAELAEIESMYLYNQIMPGKWHVDHIQPLAEGGLHHPSNLQILSEHDNCSKGARWDS